MATPVFFHSPAYAALATRVRAACGGDEGAVEIRPFPDGERYLRIRSPVQRRDVVLLSGTHSDAATLDLFDLASGLVNEGALSLSLVIPFFGYSTMERQVKPGEIVTAKTRARLISSIPQAPRGNRVALLDLHADGIAYYFEGPVVPSHVYAKPVILDAVREMGGDSFTLGSVDAGRAKWVESLANDLGVPSSFILKRRLSGTRTEVVGLSHTVGGGRVVIYDDMIRTGGSLLGAARAYLDAGATEVVTVATHGLFPGDSLARIRASGLVKRILVTDSHPAADVAAEGAAPFLQVRSCAGVLADWVNANAAG
ncbi:MAG: ribose-phosphate pyrophosphokinase [Deltaproteobacteria bacterium]|nr:ribose-phosphate pyrophosphokinase [Deltaproteobacteria bacterium]